MSQRRCSILPSACLKLAIAGAGETAADDLELGEYLASECTTCHRDDARNEGIPTIFGIPRGVFVMTMNQYRNGARDNQAMRSVAQSLSGLRKYIPRPARRSIFRCPKSSYPNLPCLRPPAHGRTGAAYRTARNRSRIRLIPHCRPDSYDKIVRDCNDL